jgi:hypothetical protein
LGSAKDEKEVALCIEELNAPSFYPSVVSLWVNDSFERKDMERELLAKLFVSLCSGQHNLLSKRQIIDGLVFFLIFFWLPISNNIGRHTEAQKPVWKSSPTFTDCMIILQTCICS